MMDDAFAVFRKKLRGSLSDEKKKEMDVVFDEWWSYFDGHTDEMRMLQS